MVKKYLEENKKTVLMLIVFVFLGVVVMVSEYRESSRTVQEGIERNEAGGAEKEETFYYKIDGQDEESVTVSVEPQMLSEKEAGNLLEKARADWEKTFLGKNTSQDRVSKDLNLPSSLEDGKVTVSYEFDNYDAIDENGKISAENIPEEGLLVQMTTEFTCQSQQTEDIRSLMLKRPVLSKEEQSRKDVEEAVSEKESSSREEAVFRLPATVDGHKVVWKARQSHGGLFILIFGVIAVFALQMREKETVRSEKKKRDSQLLLEYPQMLEQISLLLGSGMTILAAWEKIACRKRPVKNPDKQEKLYLQEMRLTYMEIREGRSERECYERFGRRIHLEPYRRFSMIINQNLSKGTENICAILETEAEEAMEMRKNNAKRLGEEASTKLLGPMMVMFLIVLVVVLVPAAANFSV